MYVCMCVWVRSSVVEQHAFNVWVRGSIPREPKCKGFKVSRFSSMVEHLICNQ